MLLMGNLSSELYKRYVNGMTHNIGSLVNNMCHRKVNCIYDVIFVLQFKNIGRDKEYRYRNASGKKITWDDCYKYNDKILRFLHKFCLKNGLKLSILGRGKTQFEQIEEQKYIQEIIPNANIKYLASMQQCESYTLLLQSQIVVVLESTMGYEMLARGKRVAYLGVREKTLDKSSRFGWPSLPKKGPFWTNINEEFEFERVLNFTVSSSDKEWNESCNKYIGNIMEYDSGNGNFLSIMKELGVPLKKEFVD
jgi:surface carbohydrate biosynthesis protein